MATEAELKLRLDPADQAAIARSPALAAARPRRRRLESVYFDTPEGLLHAHGMVLRLRREGRRWVQGLKAANLAAGGLHVRQEWEHARRDFVLDLARFAGTPLAALPQAAVLHERLVPAFRVDVVRTTWLLSPTPGSRLEVALDRGRVEGAGAAEPVSELEIECLEGGPGPAFDLAVRLLADAPLHPSPVTKAERGYRLFRGEPLAPAKARPIVLAARESPESASRRIVAAGLAQLQANEEGVLRSPDPEFVHQSRIALRRTRSALRMFRGFVGPRRALGWRDALGEVARALGAARDWDVFATEVLPALAAAAGHPAAARQIAARAQRQRREARRAARAAFGTREYAHAMLDLSRWLAEPPRAPARGEESLRDFAVRTLRKRHRRLLRAARGLGRLAPAQRHRVRIDAKRLRYGTDALASLFDAKALAAYREALGELQDALGEANDAATAMALLPKLDPPPEFAHFANAWLAARARGDPARIASLLRRLAKARRFGPR